MTTLVDRLVLSSRELISVVGAGGKTTAVRALAGDLARRGSRVVVTTTTRMGRDQVGSDALCSTDPTEVAAALASRSPLFVACGLSDEKVTGPDPGQVDALFAHDGIDHIVVEADGARKMLVKAPAEHEPQIPARSTVVVVVASLEAVGRPIAEVAHRPDLFASLAGADISDVVTIRHMASVLGSSRGGLKGVPEDARLVVLLTGAAEDHDRITQELRQFVDLDDIVAVRLDGRGSLVVVA